MLTLYLVLSTLMLIFLSILWGKKTGLDLFIKVVLVLLSLFGTVVTLQQFGFITQVSQG